MNYGRRYCPAFEFFGAFADGAHHYVRGGRKRGGVTVSRCRAWNQNIWWFLLWIDVAGERQPPALPGSMQATEPLLRKLRLSTPIDANDVTAIERLPITVKDIPAQSIIVREGERPIQCCLLIDGIRLPLENDGRGQAADPLDRYSRRYSGPAKPATARHGSRRDDAVAVVPSDSFRMTRCTHTHTRAAS